MPIHAVSSTHTVQPHKDAPQKVEVKNDKNAKQEAPKVETKGNDKSHKVNIKA